MPPYPDELAILGYIDRFGIKAVLGRDVLSAGEIKRMLFSENIVNAYRSRKASQDWGKWAEANPYLDALLKNVELSEA